MRKLGFEGPVAGDRHSRIIHSKRGQIIPIPMHKGADVSVGLIRAIIREADITVEEWLEL